VRRGGDTLAAMEVYGLTGGIGSGKSTVAEMLEEYGIPVVSADELSRMVVAPGSRGLADVVEAFGPEVLDEKGELDRKKMGRIVFTTPERRRQLEAILHPRIRERYEQVLDALEKAGHPVMVYEVPLLFEKKLDQQDEMKGVILVTATTDTRMARVKARDSLTTDDVLARMRAQMPEQEKRQRADYIVHNDGDLDDLRREVEYLISRFLRMPPRSTDQELEVEPEVEIDESEIDTLSPEEVLEEPPTAEMDLSLPDPQVEVHGEVFVAQDPRPELEISISSNPPSELEVELVPPTAPQPIPVAPPPSVAAAPPPAVAPPPPAVAPPPPVAAAPPPATQSGPPRPPRPRVGTVPQMSVPFVREKPVASDESSDGEESPS
jgi:dephospho-CoA kinase